MNIKWLGYLGVILAVLILAWPEQRTEADSGMNPPAISGETEAAGGGPRPSAMLVGQVGGEVTAVALQDDLAFLAVGSRLVVYDLSQPASPQLIGQTDPVSGLITAIAVQGD